MANNKAKTLNEIGIEAFVLAYVGFAFHLLGLFFAPILMRILGYAFGALALALLIYAVIDMVKFGKRGCYGFIVATPFAIVAGLAISIIATIVPAMSSLVVIGSAS